MPHNQADKPEEELNVPQFILDVLVLLLKIFYTVVEATIQYFIPKEPKSVRGEKVLITGAGHGIGKELALLYASEGAKVIIWDINEAGAAQTVKEIAERGYGKVHSYRCDVSKREDVLAVAKQTEKDVGEVTILINNAGIMPTHDLLDHNEEEIKRIMDINVMAHFWTLEAFLPSMKRNNNGHIVCLSSTAGLFGVPNLVPYCASKFAVRGLMQALSEELRKNNYTGVKLTSIYPFMVNTGLCKRPVIKYKKLTPMVDPKEVAREIMRAQRNDIMELAIPGHYLRMNSHIRSLPLKGQYYLADFMGVGLESDL